MVPRFPRLRVNLTWKKKQLADRAAYIHVPFCATVQVLQFYVGCRARGDLIEPYLTALRREVSWLEQPREKVDTLFFGGGTPTASRPAV